MPKLILLSLIIVTAGLPILLATRNSPKRTLRTIQIVSMVFVFIWAWMCVTFYPQMVPID